MNITLIAAVSENGVIGCDNTLPWHLKADLRHFRKTTLGHPVIMGRKTWESIGSKPLPGRTNIVLSRQLGTLFALNPDRPFPTGGRVANNLDEALAIARESHGADEVFIIGGGEVFEQAAQVASRIYLTVVHVNIADGDAFFRVPNEGWDEIRRERHGADAENQYDYSFVLYERQFSHIICRIPPEPILV